jgi:hypothetical protein
VIRPARPAEAPQADGSAPSVARPVVRLRTATGSRYDIDLGLMVWRRVTRTTRSGDLRSEGGEVIAMGPLQLGKSAALLYLPFDADVARLLVTSPLVEIETDAGTEDG